MKTDIGMGGKTLKCAGKIMASDIAVTVEGEQPQPTGETWVIKEQCELYPNDFTTQINFTSNALSFTKITVAVGIYYYENNEQSIRDALTVCEYSILEEKGIWTDQAYRTVTFDEPPTGELLTWLQANAVKQ